MIYHYAVQRPITSHRSKHCFGIPELSTIQGTATTLERAALAEAGLSDVDIEANDRHTAKIHQSIKGVSLVAVPPWGRYRISTLLLYTGLECGLFGKDKTVRHLLARSILLPSTDPIVTKLLIFLRAAGPNNQELHSSNAIYSSDLNVPLKAAYREVAFQC